MMLKSRFWMLGLLVATVVAQTGCTSFSDLMGRKRTGRMDTSHLKAAGYSIPPGGLPAPVNSDGRSLVLEVRGSKHHVEQIRCDGQKPMFVEDLVRDAKLHERLGGMQLSILRPTGSNLPPVRMDVLVKDSGKVAKLEQNYALLPGDHIIVNPDSRSSLEQFVDKYFKG
jgi:hypothetical protein